MATLTSHYNVPLLTLVDVVPLMKTAGVVKNSGHCIYIYWIKVFLKLPFVVSFSVLSIYIYVIYIYI